MSNFIVDSTYIERDATLRRLGFTSYQAYLKSKLWKIIRELVFVEKGKQCHFCKWPARQIHHTSYDEDTLTGNITHLWPICNICHKKIEFTCCGNKRSFAEAVKRFGTYRPRYKATLCHKCGITRNKSCKPCKNCQRLASSQK